MSGVQCIVVTPEKTELDATADLVIVPMFDGELGILKGRSPMIGRLGFGLLKLKTGSEEKHYYVDGGFVQVTREAVFILTDRMLDPKSLDKSAAESELQAAMAMNGSTPEAMKLKERALAQTRAKARLANR